MKLLLDFLPLILFFTTFKIAEGHKAAAAAFATQHFAFLVSGGQVGPEEAPVLLATLVVITATLAQALITRLLGRKIDLMLWISMALVTVLGGLTVWFHNETFIKWKPTGVYWAMALTFWGSQALFGKNLIKVSLKETIHLPEQNWLRLNWAWAGFFAFMGVLNLWVAFNFSTSTWASFKAFGTIGLMIVFVLGQGFYLARHLPDEEPAAEEPKP
ncbi:septation protein A [Pelomonas sp. SE-A7]|uniref:septation protein A n=1 Tax=Pelomonas sp. SE-A7 TaxID=3054953 RepID=UPI00259CB8E3|nr:septation protein A [Pelomonas sp. SE-A7]MDM4766068.1 septation protein A [Pelomonas sp. SE-A7]